jgi:hypothetical protein
MVKEIKMCGNKGVHLGKNLRGQSNILPNLATSYNHIDDCKAFARHFPKSSEMLFLFGLSAG